MTTERTVGVSAQNWERIRDELLEQIVTGHITGVLNARNLAREHNVSIDRITSIFIDLQHQEIGTRAGRYTFRIREVGISEFAAAVKMREQLEPWTFTQAAGRVPPEEIEPLIQLYQTLEPVNRRPRMAWVLDDHVHGLAGTYSGNQASKRTLVSLSRTIRLFRGSKRFEEFHGPRRVVEVAAQHSDILDALLRGRAHEGTRMIVHHIQGNAFAKLGRYI